MGSFTDKLQAVGRLTNLFEPQFPYLQNENKNIIYLEGLL